MCRVDTSRGNKRTYVLVPPKRKCPSPLITVRRRLSKNRPSHTFPDIPKDGRCNAETSSFHFPRSKRHIALPPSPKGGLPSCTTSRARLGPDPSRRNRHHPRTDPDRRVEAASLQTRRRPAHPGAPYPDRRGVQPGGPCVRLRRSRRSRATAGADGAREECQDGERGPTGSADLAAQRVWMVDYQPGLVDVLCTRSCRVRYACTCLMTLVADGGGTG